MREVLHITTHMGGGVGKVLSGVASYTARMNTSYRHRILLLEQPEKTNFVEICRARGVELICGASRDELQEAVHSADIVQIEWWHHPRMAAFLANFPNVKTRLAVWAHVSGCYYPYIPTSFLRIPQCFIFTSPYSLENPYWSAEEQMWARAHCSVVYSSGGFVAEASKQSERTDGRFVVGYVGTQSFAKLHHDFVRYCQSVSHIPGIVFVLVGDTTNREQILEEAREAGIDQKFHFIDYVSDVNAELAQMDVFGYLLNPHHFGTTENALLEAMAAGLPVVARNQCTEKYLIAHGQTGMLVHDIKEYRQTIEWLFAHPKERSHLGRAAREAVLRDFSAVKTVEHLHAVYAEMMTKPPRTYDFQKTLGQHPYEYFLNGLPPQLRQIFEADTSVGDDALPTILKEHSKSSLPHFCRIFDEDKQLKDWQHKFCSAGKENMKKRFSGEM